MCHPKIHSDQRKPYSFWLLSLDALQFYGHEFFIRCYSVHQMRRQLIILLRKKYHDQAVSITKFRKYFCKIFFLVQWKMSQKKMDEEIWKSNQWNMKRKNKTQFLFRISKGCCGYVIDHEKFANASTASSNSGYRKQLNLMTGEISRFSLVFVCVCLYISLRQLTMANITSRE